MYFLFLYCAVNGLDIVPVGSIPTNNYKKKKILMSINQKTKKIKKIRAYLQIWSPEPLLRLPVSKKRTLNYTSGILHSWLQEPSKKLWTYKVKKRMLVAFVKRKEKIKIFRRY
jgi:hypothetical protein